jgi:hypothetical protein
VGLRAGDGADRSGPETVVLGVVGRVGGLVDGGIGVAERDIVLDPTSAKTTRAGGQCVALPRPLRAAGGPDVEVIADADDPHRGVGAQLAVLAADREFEFDGVFDPAQLIVRPPTGGAHTHPRSVVHDHDATSGRTTRETLTVPRDNNDSLAS